MIQVEWKQTFFYNKNPVWIEIFILIIIPHSSHCLSSLFPPQPFCVRLFAWWMRFVICVVWVDLETSTENIDEFWLYGETNGGRNTNNYNRGFLCAAFHCKYSKVWCVTTCFLINESSRWNFLPAPLSSDTACYCKKASEQLGTEPPWLFFSAFFTVCLVFLCAC